MSQANIAGALANVYVGTRRRLPVPQQGPRSRLLLVDDEQDILDFLERALRRDYDVTRFDDPMAALAQLRVGAYDVLITDQWMPVLSGLELLAEAQALHPSIVRVLISGFADAPHLNQAIAARQIHNFVLKPITSRQLLEAIEAATARARA